MNTVITITGPSCSGKTTLAAYLSAVGIPEVQSFTTRAPRANEDPHGSGSYEFVTRDWALEKRPEELVEIVSFGGNFYGNTIDQLERAFARSVTTPARVCVVVEPEGVKHWKNASATYGFKAFSIYLSQTRETLIRRCAERLREVRGESIVSELDRIKNCVTVEHDTWPDRHDYDLTVHGIGTPQATATQEMISGLLLLS